MYATAGLVAVLSGLVAAPPPPIPAPAPVSAFATAGLATALALATPTPDEDLAVVRLSDEPRPPDEAELDDEAVYYVQQQLYEHHLANEAEIARRVFREFCKRAVESGELAALGLSELEWGPYLGLLCDEIQNLLEGWLVATRRYLELGDFGEEMLARQDAHWRRHGLRLVPGRMLVQNEVINLCPGTLKSTFLCVLANAWIWLHAPGFAFGASSYSEKNVSRDSIGTRDLVSSSWYRETFDIRWTIRLDTARIEHWATTAGGHRYSMTTGTGFTGLHLDGIFLDDPDDAWRVWNEPERRRIQGKWTSSIENRVRHEDRVIRVILQQRVHVDDLSAHVLGKSKWGPGRRKGWAWFVLPLQYGRGPKEAPPETPYGARDWRTVVDEIMHVRFSDEVIADKIVNLGAHGFASQYNQNATPLDVGMFQRAKLRWFVDAGTVLSSLRQRPIGCPSREELPPVELVRDSSGQYPALDWVTVSVDCSNGGESLATSSAVGIGVLGGQGERRYYLDDRTGVLGIQEMYDRVAGTVADWAPQCGRVLVELKAAGPSTINELKKQLEDGRITDRFGASVQVVVEPIKVPPHEGYVQRARAMVPTVEGGYLYIRDGADWVYPKVVDDRLVDEGVVEELCQFPHAKRDDRVDLLSQAITYYRTEGAAVARAMALNQL